MTERLHFHFSLSCIGEGNGNPLQCSCLENPRDREAWWAAVSGVVQSRTRLKRLCSSSSSSSTWLPLVEMRICISTAISDLSDHFPTRSSYRYRTAKVKGTPSCCRRHSHCNQRLGCKPLFLRCTLELHSLVRVYLWTFSEYYVSASAGSQGCGEGPGIKKKLKQTNSFVSMGFNIASN